jgi:hypothetical protein
VVVIVGDGNDSNNASVKTALADMQRTARAAGVETRAVLAPGGAVGASTVEQAGIATVDASKVDLTHALAEAMGGTVLTPPKAVMVVFEAGEMWPTTAVLAALGEGLAHVDLPRDSRIGAIACSAAARIQIPLEPAPSFKAAQLGTARDYSGVRGADLTTGLTLAAEALAKAPEADKLIVVVGNAGDFETKEVELVLNDLPGKVRSQGIEVRAIHYGPAAPGTVLQWLDRKGRQVTGATNQGTLEQLGTVLHDVVR